MVPLAKRTVPFGKIVGAFEAPLANEVKSKAEPKRSGFNSC